MRYIRNFLLAVPLATSLSCLSQQETQIPLCRVSKQQTTSGISVYVDSRGGNRPGGSYPRCDIIFLAKDGEIGNYTVKCEGHIVDVGTIDKASPQMKLAAETVERDYKLEREKGCRVE